MDFSGLVKAVREFWDFIWPPVICLAMLVIIARVVAAGTVARIWTWVKIAKPKPESQLAAAKTLKHFGVDKLVPFALAFCLLFALDMVRATVVMAGDAMSPKLVYPYDIWLAQRANDDRFKCLWMYYGDFPKLSEFQNHMDRTLTEEEARDKNSRLLISMGQWEEQNGKAAASFAACKFFIAWALLWATLEMVKEKTVWKPVSRFLICLAVFLIAGTVFFFRQVWAVDQSESARLAAVEVLMAQKVNKDYNFITCSKLSDDMEANFEKVVGNDRRSLLSDGVRRWWEVRAFDSYYLRWIRFQLTGHPL